MVCPDLTNQVHKKQQTQKENHDKRSTHRHFNVGDNVFVHKFPSNDDWIPETITKTTGPLSYVIKLETRRTVCCHVDHIRHWTEVPNPEPLLDWTDLLDVALTPQAEDNTALAQMNWPLPHTNKNLRYWDQSTILSGREFSHDVVFNETKTGFEKESVNKIKNVQLEVFPTFTSANLLSVSSPCSCGTVIWFIRDAVKAFNQLSLEYSLLLYTKFKKFPFWHVETRPMNLLSDHNIPEQDVKLIPLKSIYKCF